MQRLMADQDRAGPARAAQDALQQLLVVEKDIPVMKALTNPRFKEAHWRKVSTRLRFCRRLLPLELTEDKGRLGCPSAESVFQVACWEANSKMTSMLVQVQ